MVEIDDWCGAGVMLDAVNLHTFSNFPPPDYGVDLDDGIRPLPKIYASPIFETHFFQTRQNLMSKMVSPPGLVCSAVEIDQSNLNDGMTSTELTICGKSVYASDSDSGFLSSERASYSPTVSTVVSYHGERNSRNSRNSRSFTSSAIRSFTSTRIHLRGSWHFRLHVWHTPNDISSSLAVSTVKTVNKLSVMQHKCLRPVAGAFKAVLAAGTTFLAPVNTHYSLGSASGESKIPATYVVGCRGCQAKVVISSLRM